MVEVGGHLEIMGSRGLQVRGFVVCSRVKSFYASYEIWTSWDTDGGGGADYNRYWEWGVGKGASPNFVCLVAVEFER